MKSGLGDRNNMLGMIMAAPPAFGLNEVRSWRPEQFSGGAVPGCQQPRVSMKSGLGDRNNMAVASETFGIGDDKCLNEVRSWRPEQYPWARQIYLVGRSLNEVRSWRPEQSRTGLMAVFHTHWSQ